MRRTILSNKGSCSFDQRIEELEEKTEKLKRDKDDFSRKQREVEAELSSYQGERNTILSRKNFWPGDRGLASRESPNRR